MYDHPFHDQDISGKNFLISGGAGFVGSNIAAYLIKYGAGKVRVLDNLLTGNKENIQEFINNDQLEFIKGDITDLDTCKKACEGIDHLCHQAALGSVPRSIANPTLTNKINVEGTLNMFYAAKEMGVKSIVYASSSSVYGDHPDLPKVEENIGKQLSPYAVSKYSNELYAEVFRTCYDMKMIGLRYFNIFGPNQSPKGAYAAVIPLFVDKLLKGEPVYIDGDGGQTRDFTYVENAVQANIKAMLCENQEAYGKVYNIAVGENYSVLYLYEQVRELLEVSQDPEFRAARKGDIRNSLADISKAKKYFGYDPKYRFEDGLKETVAYFQNQLNTHR